MIELLKHMLNIHSQNQQAQDPMSPTPLHHPPFKVQRLKLSFPGAPHTLNPGKEQQIIPMFPP